MVLDGPVSGAGAIVLYVVAAMIVLWPTYAYGLKQSLFCVINIAAGYLTFFHGSDNGVTAFSTLVIAMLGHWFVIRLLNNTENESDSLYWIAFLLPIILLLVVKTQSALQIIGVSYMAFRMAQTAFEMRGRDDLKCSLPEYLAFLFFPPTLSSGPISPFSFYQSTSDGTSISLHNVGHGLFRIAIGYIKLRYLALLPQQISLSALWQDSIYEIGYADYLAAGAGYYLFLYMNFAGYTDIVIGVSALIGIRVKENFNNPLMARSVMDFWGRWHMSLTQFVRDAIFAPTMTTLIRKFGSAYSTHGALLSVFLIFTVLALWHGVAPGYFIFYMLHAAAFATIYILDQRQRRKGTKSYAAYRDSGVRLWGGRVATFVFLSLTCPFLEWPHWEQIQLFPFLRWQ